MNLYIKRRGSNQLQIINDVTSRKRGTRVVWAGTYRNDWVGEPGRGYGSGSPSVVYTFSTSPTISGQHGALLSTGTTPLRYVETDSVRGVPPRFRAELQSGTWIADDAAVTIPTVFLLASFTANVSTDVCTAAAHGMTTGDVVMVASSGTLYTGLTSTDLYTVLVLDANTFKLSLNGALVDLSGSPTGTHTLTRVHAAAVDALPLYFVPDAEEQGMSNTDPRIVGAEA